MANDWLDKDPFRSYKITTKENHRNFLLKEELEVLVNEKISIQHSHMFLRQEQTLE